MSAIVEDKALLNHLRRREMKRYVVTMITQVLVEGDDLTDPVADTARSILDGHVVLSRDLAARDHYPAVDVLQSTSRLMMDLAPPEQRKAAARLRRLLAAYRDAEDLVNIGAYQAGTNADVDEALAKRSAIEAFLTQGMQESWSLEASVAALLTLFPGEA